MADEVEMDPRMSALFKAIGNVLLCFEDWPQYTGSDYCEAERRNALDALNEATISMFYAGAATDNG